MKNKYETYPAKERDQFHVWLARSVVDNLAKIKHLPLDQFLVLSDALGWDIQGTRPIIYFVRVIL